MQRIPYTSLEDVKRDRAEMEAFKEELKEADKVARQPQQSAEDSHKDEFYCGICGWSPISTFPHDH